jgi:uncharacterized protein YacL
MVAQLVDAVAMAQHTQTAETVQVVVAVVQLVDVVATAQHMQTVETVQAVVMVAQPVDVVTQTAEIVVSLIIAKIPEFIALAEGKFVTLIILVPVSLVIVAIFATSEKNSKNS